MQKLVWLFFIGCLLGDITETIFCRITAGVWMSRSSLVWGPFSIVWGFAIAAVTDLLYKYKDRSDRFLFLMGTALGGAYEYLCSWVGEKVLGVIFWDYSHIPFNLNGRVNLLYCLFWGIAAVAWVKVVYPRLSRLVERFIGRKHRVFASIVTAFMVVDIVLSAAALVRYGQRQEGDRTPTNVVEQFLDEHYDDAYLEHRYQNMKLAQ